MLTVATYNSKLRSIPVSRKLQYPLACSIQYPCGLLSFVYCIIVYFEVVAVDFKYWFGHSHRVSYVIPGKLVVEALLYYSILQYRSSSKLVVDLSCNCTGVALSCKSRLSVSVAVDC